MTNLDQNLLDAAAARPDAVALVSGDRELTYREFDAAAGRVASYLESVGVEPGDRVGIMLPNCLAWPQIFYGVMRRGAVAVPMNPLFKGREVEYYLSNTGAKVLFGHPGFAAEAEAGTSAAGARLVVVDDAALDELVADFEPAAPVAREGTDLAVILHTSGTTGRPKGAMLTHFNLRRNTEVLCTTLTHATSDDVIIGVLPLFHVFGLTCALNASVAVGASIVLVPRFEPRLVLDLIRSRGVTLFSGVPTMYSALLAAHSEDDDVSTLRMCTSGGSALPLQVIEDFQATFGAPILEGYGLSETSPVASFNHPDRPRKAGTVGTPLLGVQMRIADAAGNALGPGEDGEIQIRGENIMAGYWNMPEATADAIDADGWFATGDIGRVDADGYYSIVDRKKELVIRGGLNVYPREIEEVLYEHPAVAEAAVIGVPHETLGEEIGAAIAFKAGVVATVDEVREFVRARVAPYKYPRHIWILDELPKGATGKIQKRDITVPAVS